LGNQLPFVVVQAMIQCFGLSFHYKDTMAAFLAAAGIPNDIVDKFRDEPKFVWARKTLSELGQSPDGCILQQRLLTELFKLRDLPDKNVPDPDAGLDALRKLKRLTLDHDLVVAEKKNTAERRENIAAERTKQIQERASRLEALRNQFNAALLATNRQGSGYCLEDILKDLFALFELEYKKPYRTETQQIDGHFRFEGFDYLVEAKWWKGQPPESEVFKFKGKVDDKFRSTRGLFVSIEGVREEVARRFDGHGCNILFFDGSDLVWVLEGRVDLRDALRFKIEKAAQHGIASSPLRDHF